MQKQTLHPHPDHDEQLFLFPLDLTPLLLFHKVCSKFGTIVAKISRSQIEKLKVEDQGLYHIIDKVLLQASLMELANLDVS